MSTAPNRQHRSSFGTTLAAALLVFSFSTGVTGAVLSLLKGLNLRTTPILTNTEVAGVLFAAGILAVIFFLPVVLALWLS